MKLMRRNRESGYVLIGVLVLVTLMMIALDVVVILALTVHGSEIRPDRSR